MRLRLLLLAPFPYGTTSGHGGALVCAAMLKQLARDHEVRVLCFSADAEHDAPAVQEMRTHAQVELVPLNISKLKVLQAKLFTWLRFVPEMVIYHESPAYVEALSQLEHEYQPDVVMTQFPQMAQYLAHVQCPVRVHDVQDAYSVSWYRRALSARPAKRPYAFWQWLTWLAYERRYYTKAGQCWTLSEEDSFGLKVFIPALTAVSVGIPLLEELGAAEHARPAKLQAPVVGFIASYSHPPNAEALACIVHEIAPALLHQLPDAKVLIAGRNPPRDLVAAAPSNMEFIGFVDSLEAFYAGCDVIVAPLLSGGGVKIKVVEAMGFGKAVVTTAVGAEGTGIAGSDAAFVTDVQRMPGILAHLLQDEALRRRTELIALELVGKRFSAEQWRVRVGRYLASAMQQEVEPVQQGV